LAGWRSDEELQTHRSRLKAMHWKRLTLIVVGVLAFLGALLFFTWPGMLPHRPVNRPALSSAGRPSGALTVASCVGSTGPLMPREFLDSRHIAATGLISEKHFDRAVAELRNIADADPAYPGINLDLSDALLQSDHAQQAKSAINSQISISDCLVGLPDQALRDYCGVELEQTSKESCRTQLAEMQRSAHFQAALIDMAMASSIRPTATVEVAKNSYITGPATPAASSPPELAEVRPATPLVTEEATPLATKKAAPLATKEAAPLVTKEAEAAKAAPKAPRVGKDLAPALAPARPKPTVVAVSAPSKPMPAAAVRVSAPPAAGAPTPAGATPALVETAAVVQPMPPVDRTDAPSRTSGTASGTLLPSEAAQHIGETRTVCGPVADKHTAAGANGSPTFLELERAYPNQIFTVLIWASDKGEVGDLPGTGNVCVTGKIATYAGLPEIILHTAHDWSVPHGTPNP
jgi:hypothetical protein